MSELVAGQVVAPPNPPKAPIQATPLVAKPQVAPVVKSEVTTKTEAPSKVDAPAKVEEPDDKDDIDPAGLIPTEPYQTSPLFYEVANYFGIDQHDYDKAKDELSVIVDWAIQSSQSNKIEDVLTALRKTEDSIMNPGWGERRYSNMYRYLRLQSKADAFQKALSAYKKEGM